MASPGGADGPARTTDSPNSRSGQTAEASGESLWKADQMPRQRIHHTRETYGFPDDFPERLERFQEESGLSWAEIARRLDVHHETIRRWRKGRARPSMRNMMALVALARPLGLAHLFTD